MEKSDPQPPPYSPPYNPPPPQQHYSQPPQPSGYYQPPPPTNQQPFQGYGQPSNQQQQQNVTYINAQPGYNHYQPLVQTQQIMIQPCNNFQRNMLPFTPATMQCPSCSQNIITRIDYKIGLLVWIVMGMMVLFGLILGCCLIPLCISSLKDVEHSCPNCNVFIGRRDRLY